MPGETPPPYVEKAEVPQKDPRFKIREELWKLFLEKEKWIQEALKQVTGLASWEMWIFKAEKIEAEGHEVLLRNVVLRESNSTPEGIMNTWSVDEALRRAWIGKPSITLRYNSNLNRIELQKKWIDNKTWEWIKIISYGDDMPSMTRDTLVVEMIKNNLRQLFNIK